jgi:hypothetical protein
LELEQERDALRRNLDTIQNITHVPSEAALVETAETIPSNGAIYQSDLDSERSGVPILEAPHSHGQTGSTTAHRPPTLARTIGGITLEGPVIDQVFNM